MRTINDEWDAYFKKVLPANASEVQIRETRQAFFSGAFCLMQLLKTQTDDEGIEVLENLERTMTAHVANRRREIK